MTDRPDPSNYPKWLREILFPDNPFEAVRSNQDLRENEKALRQVWEQHRANPELRILWMITLEVIRYRFRFYEIEQNYSEKIAVLGGMVLNLEERLEKLEKKLEKKKGVKVK